MTTYQSTSSIMNILGRGNSFDEGNEYFSFLVSLNRGQVHSQLVNQRLTKVEVAAILKTGDDSITKRDEKR